MKKTVVAFTLLMVGCTPKNDNSCLVASEGKVMEIKEEKGEKMEISSETKKSPKPEVKLVEVPSRKDIDNTYKWDPSAVFSSNEDWVKERDALIAILKLKTGDKSIGRFEGKLKLGATTVKKAMDEIYNLRLRIEKLYFYASRVRDVDMRNSEGGGMVENAKKLYNDFGTATSWMEPEFLRLGVAKLNLYRKSALLKDYSRYFEKLIREKKHVLGKKEEKLLGLSGSMEMVSYDIYSTFSNSDMEFPVISLGKGQKVRIDQAMYVKYRASLDRKERKKVFSSFWGTFKKYRNTFASALSGQVKFNTFTARARNYKDGISSALEPKNIPVSYYTGLIKGINDNLDAFHEYLSLRKKLLGVNSDLEYYDIYPPLVSGEVKSWKYEDALNLVKKALEPLGKDYASHLAVAFAKGSGWIDVYPNKGKRSGAYMDSVFGKHPYVLLNYNGNFDSVSTLAHEMGHAIHSVYSMASQPYAKSNYVIFNAEVASIMNEALLIEYMLKKEKDPAVRRFLLSHYLDSFRGTVFRQTMFAEFEYNIYKAYEDGKALTADLMDNMYLELLKKYHGHDKKVMKIDELYSTEWAFIPHFYYHFYVYSYVNGFIAATYLADKVLSKGDAAAKKYITGLLKAGSSKDPLEILKDAGVDMQSPATFKAAIDKFRSRVNELKELTK
ncbi:MAG: oligoendopeptidase F [Deltaproteobacteria bacterium]|nr:oligoendopeptidase F [Deltaproteobacteria bacterium]